MRIEFVHGERPGLDWDGGALHIGSAAEHAVRLEGPGVAADHLVLHGDAHGLWLQVQPGAERVHVNARPVREYALLRLGDTISVGGHRLLLRVADGARIDDFEEETDAPAPAASVRAVAGRYSGRSWSVHDGLQLGRAVQRVADANQADDPGLLVSWRHRQLWLDICPDTPDVISVNGVIISTSVRLHNGDCIGLGGQRFVIDAWSLVPVADDAGDAQTAPVDAKPPENAAGPRGDIWWLLLTAAVLGLLIALFLLLRL